MAAIESLLSLMEMRKADGLVLQEDQVPELLGGPGGGLTMPPLNGTVMGLFVEDLLSESEREEIKNGKPVTSIYQSDNHGTFELKARTIGDKTKLVLRRKSGAKKIEAASGPALEAPALRNKFMRVAPTDPAITPPVPTPAAASDSPVALWVDDAPAALPGALAELLQDALERNASDVFLSVGRPPYAKCEGSVVTLGRTPVDDPLVYGLMAGPRAQENHAALREKGAVDLSFVLPDSGTRFRVNVFRQIDGVAAVLRPIARDIPSLAALGLPTSLSRITQTRNGLVLMTGPTGSGKSTTLAALLAQVNDTRACHIVTLEDPIEHQYPRRQALVHQREIGTHVPSFSEGLRAALRESPDILLLGEMRDPETIAMALTAAETGHLVLSTLHAASAAGAIERVINAFSENKRSGVQAQLAACLRFVITQHLVLDTAGGRVPVVEQMAVNHAVAAQIRDGRTQMLNSQIELGAQDGMVTIDAALTALVRKGRISKASAFAVATNREALEKNLSGI